MREPMHLASRAQRFWAILIDMTIFAFLYIGARVTFKVQPALAIIFLLLLIAYGIYQIALLSNSGQTIGKKLLGVQIRVMETGQNGGFVVNVLKRGVLASLLNIVPFFYLADTFFIFRQDRRCIHDFIAGTQVITSSNEPPTRHWYDYFVPLLAILLLAITLEAHFYPQRIRLPGNISARLQRWSQQSREVRKQGLLPAENALGIKLPPESQIVSTHSVGLFTVIDLGGFSNRVLLFVQSDHTPLTVNQMLSALDSASQELKSSPFKEALMAGLSQNTNKSERMVWGSLAPQTVDHSMHYYFADELPVATVTFPQRNGNSRGRLAEWHHNGRLVTILAYPPVGDFNASAFEGFMEKLLTENTDLAALSQSVAAKAQQGIASAQYRYGMLLTNGFSVAKDDKQAAYWFAKASEQNFAPAQAILGMMYSAGKGVTKDIAKGTGLIKQSAEQGFFSGELAMGTMYLRGFGEPKNPYLAYVWFNLVRDADILEAGRFIQEASAQLTPDQRQKALLQVKAFEARLNH